MEFVVAASTHMAASIQRYGCMTVPCKLHAACIPVQAGCITVQQYLVFICQGLHGVESLLQISSTGVYSI